MYIMTSRPWTRVSVQARQIGIQSQGYREPGRLLGLVMAAMVISISSDLSDESVGSSFSRVILIGSISVEVLVALEVGAAAVASPAGLPTPLVILLFDSEDDLEHPSHTIETSTSSRYVSTSLTSRNS
ncbi:hypothetical protein Tco_0663328 [Tanacetum coccineum]